MSHDSKNLFIAIILSIIVIGGWQYFFEVPRHKAQAETRKTSEFSKLEAEENKANIIQEAQTISLALPAGKIQINTDKLQGYISLRGLRFESLEFKKYKQTIAENSPLVKLFNVSGLQAYFAEFGWLAGKDNSQVPNKESIWQCDGDELVTNKALKCNWNSSNGIHYQIIISVDNDYLFTIKQNVANHSDASVSFANYGRLFKSYAQAKEFAILHEGAIGVFSDVLKEATYEDLSKERQEIYTNTKGSWAGFTDKYWLSAIIADHHLASKTNFVASSATNSVNPHDLYNVNFVTQDIDLQPGQNTNITNYLFAGAKEEKILARYQDEYDFKLFDRSIDFGIFYLITKPLFWLISYFYSLLGNFGLAIIAVTLSIKLIMYPLANKSYKSMAKMKELQPMLDQIKKRCGDDKMRLNKEVMELYKKEKINPAAGCLPLLIQIPVFFSLYKVIFISIEMRHAPFYGWIKDLSAQDPTSIWNLFGLMPWGDFGFLNIGVWPIIMAVTMFIQQKLGPEPTDPVQGAVMKFMPLVLVVMLYSLPSGLMIYWSFSNILSIIQQYAITKSNIKK